MLLLADFRGYIVTWNMASIYRVNGGAVARVDAEGNEYMRVRLPSERGSAW